MDWTYNIGAIIAVACMLGGWYYFMKNWSEMADG